MINSKLIQLLKSLSASELKELQSFLLSSFHNKNKVVPKLYKLLIRYAPDFNHSALQKEAVADRLFSQTESSRIKKLQYAMSDFVKILESYLMMKELDSTGEEHSFLLLQIFKKRGLEKFFFKKAADFDKQLEGMPFRDIEYFHLKYRLNNLILTHPNTEKVSKSIDSFKETFEYLDSFYLSSKFLQAIVFNDRRHTFEEDYDFFIKKELLELTDKQELNDVPLFKIYKLLMREMKEDTLAAKVSIYFELKKEVFKNLEIFREPYREDLVICILNLTTRLYRLGAKGFDSELFEFYKLLLNDYYTSVGNELQSSVFINVIILACESGEHEWAEHFICNNIHLLNVTEQIPMRKLAEAYLSCSKCNYDETLIFLRDMEYPNVYYQSIAKFLSVRCFFEMEEEEMLYTYLKTFENFIRRHTQLTEIRKAPILHFIKFTRKVYTNKYNRKYSKKQLFFQLEGIPSISYGSWLRRMIEALE